MAGVTARPENLRAEVYGGRATPFRLLESVETFRAESGKLFDVLTVGEGKRGRFGELSPAKACASSKVARRGAPRRLSWHWRASKFGLRTCVLRLVGRGDRPHPLTGRIIHFFAKLSTLFCDLIDKRRACPLRLTANSTTPYTSGLRRRKKSPRLGSSVGRAPD